MKKNFSNFYLGAIILTAIAAVSTILFLSNIFMMLHQNTEVTGYKIFETSFYYYTPLISWGIILALLIKYVRSKANSFTHRDLFVKLLLIGIILSPVIRAFDIAVDFTIKYLVGMISINPFLLLANVRLVILGSLYQPILIFIIVSLFLIWYFKLKSDNSQSNLKLKEGTSLYNVALHDVQFLKSTGNYLEINTRKKKYKVRGTLKGFKMRLSNDFVQVHRSVIVNQNNIDELIHWRNCEYLIKMNNNLHVTSSRSYKNAIENLLIKSDTPLIPL